MLRPNNCCHHSHCREAEELLGALDEASAFCSSALEELDGNGSEGPHSRSGILLRHTLEISELATAAAKVESSVLTLYITTQPAGTVARESMANCTRSLVTCLELLQGLWRWRTRQERFNRFSPLPG